MPSGSAPCGGELPGYDRRAVRNEISPSPFRIGVLSIPPAKASIGLCGTEEALAVVDIVLGLVARKRFRKLS